MERLTLEMLYKKEGLHDYTLRDINDLRKIHDIKVENIEGYNKLCKTDKDKFNKFLVEYYNAHNVKERWIIPIKLFKALEEDYIKEDAGQAVLVRRVTYIIGGNNDRKIYNIWRREHSENMFNRLGSVRSCIKIRLIVNGKDMCVNVN